MLQLYPVLKNPDLLWLKAGTFSWKEKNVIAIVDGKEILAVGDEAYAMFERTPGNIEVVFPMKEGVISRFTDMQYLLQNLLKKERHNLKFLSILLFLKQLLLCE